MKESEFKSIVKSMEGMHPALKKLVDTNVRPQEGHNEAIDAVFDAYSTLLAALKEIEVE